MSERPISRRRVALVILAVAIPSLALIGLGVGLILQESQLQKSRQTETYNNTFNSLSAALNEIAIRRREEAANHAVESGWSSAHSAFHSTGFDSTGFDSTIVLVSQVKSGELLLPWQLDGRAEIFGSRIHSGSFGRAILRAERSEFTNGSPGQAIRAYRTAIVSTKDTLQRAFAQLSLARALKNSNRDEEANEVRLTLIELPFHFVDDFGVPLSLYAVQQLAHDVNYSSQLVDILNANARLPLYLSPQAGYLYRAIYDTLKAVLENDFDSTLARKLAAIDSYASSTLSSIRLQEDFRSVFPRLISPAGEHNYELYSNNHWLLTLSSDSSRSKDDILVVIDTEKVLHEAADRVRLSESGYEVSALSSESSTPNRWLGPPFQGIYGQLTAVESSGAPRSLMNRISFIILAMSLVIGLTALGFYLWWRDTRRELHTARLRSDFVSSVSHELKTPLTSIRMFAETLRFRSPPNELREDYLDTIINESGRLTRLLNNVLDFSKIDEGAKSYQLQPTVLGDVITTALQAMEYPFQAQNFEIRKQIPDEEIRVNADRDALEQVLLNLLTNAMKFSVDRREIEVGLRKNGISAECWVADHGIGIETDDMDRIFSSYFRADNAVKANVPGTGLGLSLVKHTVDGHHGHITVTSIPGKGSTFTIKLPLI